MSITPVDVSTQVLVHAEAQLEVEGVTMVVGRRTARIKRARIRWFYGQGEWEIDYIHVWGPVIRKSDGAESSIHVSENTRPSWLPAQHSLRTPEAIALVAAARTPDWIPRMEPSPYPRWHGLRYSL